MIDELLANEDGLCNNKARRPHPLMSVAFVMPWAVRTA